MSINRIRKLNDEINSLFKFDDGEFLLNSNHELFGSTSTRGTARTTSYNDNAKLGF